MARSRKRKLLIGVAVLLAAFLGLRIAAPYVLKNQRVHRALTARLSAAFGRPVEAGRFDVSFAGGPRLQAENVGVAEDARFGYEDFLRAERVTAAVRWQALFTGRLEFGTLLFTRPSFNVVRTADGGWNLSAWLPAAQAGGAAGAAPGSSAGGARLARMEIDGGRINFKRGVDKHPFALTSVEGFLERRGENAWQVDLRAVPMRAGIVVQEPGILEVRGVVRAAAAGSSPADLGVQWADASISDALRLAVGHDYGVRGNASLDAQIRWPAAGPAGEPPATPVARPVDAGSLVLAVRLAGVHRWDLPARAADPALNLSVQADWRLPFLLEVKNGVVEAPGSNVRFSGSVSAGSPQPPGSLRVISSAISLNDLFCWYRAFRPGVSDAITVEGHSGIDLEIRGWPARLERAVMASGGATVRFGAPAGAGDALSMGPAELRFTRDPRTQASQIELKPVTLTFGDPRRESAASSVRTGALRVDAVVFPSKIGASQNWRAEWNVVGQTARAQQWWAAAGAMGVPPVTAWAANGWNVLGPASVRLRWLGTAWPMAVEPSGTLDLSGAALNAAFLNQPVRLANTRIEFAGGERRVNFSNAQLFGAAWSGTLRSRAGQPWEVTVAAELLDAAEIDRWLNPAAAQSAPGILGRFTPGGGATRELPAGLRAEGRLSVAQFTLGALTLRRLRGNVQLETGRAWRLNLTGAQADFFGGSVDGNFAAEFDAAAARPAYRADASLTGVSLAALSAASPRTAGLFEGQLAGRVNISAAGVGRDALLGSLGASGAVQIRGARTRLMDLPASLRAGGFRRGSSEFTLAGGEFGLDADKKLQIASLRLTLPPGRSPVLTTAGSEATIRLTEERPLAANQLDVSGNVEWFGVPDTRLSLDIFVPDVARNRLASGDAQRGSGAGRMFQLRGTLAAPQLTPAPPARAQ